MSTSVWIAEDDQGRYGQPGSGYWKMWAGIRKVKRAHEIKVVSAGGSNQGYLEENYRSERRYRAETIDQLMRVAIAEIRREASNYDSPFSPSGPFEAAIRNASFAAMDQD